MDFKRCYYGPGAVLWDQRGNDTDQTAALLTFDGILVEDTHAPFLSLTTRPNVTGFLGWEGIAISNLMLADSLPHQWSDNHQPVVSINCPSVDLSPTYACTLMNLVISSAQTGVGDHPAVRVIRGQVRGVQISTPAFDGPLDVRDANDLPAGSYVAATGSGHVIVGKSDHMTPVASHLLRNPCHALLVGSAGEANARFALSHDGSMHWGDGGADPQGFTASLTSQRVQRAALDALSIAPAAAHVGTVAFAGALPGDACTPSHDGLGANPVQLSCHVSAADAVTYVVRNAGSAAVTVGAGKLMMALARYG